MIFSQIEYFLFFGLIFVLHWALPRRHRVAALFVASLLFYGSWNMRYLVLILGSTLLDFIAARRMAAASERHIKRRWLWASLAGNLGSLGVFKYYEFFVGSAATLLGALGLEVHASTLGLLLPVGISFYTFQSMSYTIDVYRGEREPEPSLLRFATYVAFFPQLVAGPIVRSYELLGQLRAGPSISVDRVKRGGKLFLWGLIKKNIFADLVAIKCVDVVFARPGDFDTATLWLAAVGYSLQIYADFSGYTDMARGSALLLGYELPENFQTPYRSRSITEFWRRWHISLSSWLRDYLYISLGGNRRGRLMTYRNLMLTMLLGGLWHGAAWTFVAWGGLHGGALAVHRVWVRTARGEGWDRARRTLLYSAVAGVGTFLFACLCFVLFRAQTFGDALAVAVGMFVPTDGERVLHPVALGPVLIFAVGTLAGAHLDVPRLYRAVPWPLRSVGYAVAVMGLLLLTHASGVPFVYFQF